MLSNTSDFGSDRTDQADVYQRMQLEEAHRRGTAPITYRVLYIENGSEVTEVFKSFASERVSTMREKFGIHPDNKPYALQAMGSNGRWNKPPIGNPDLCAKLGKMR